MTGITEYLHQNYLVSKGELCSARSFDFMEKIEKTVLLSAPTFFYVVADYRIQW